MILALLICGGAILYYYLAFLEYSSSLTAPVTGKIKVSRIKNGMPIIEASNKSDAFFALGRVHAQDRLPLMEYLRVFASGKAVLILKDNNEARALSNLIEMLEIDKRADEIVSTLSADEKNILLSYVNGINHYKHNSSYSSSDTPIGVDYDWSLSDPLKLLLFFNWVDSFLNNREFLFPVMDKDYKRELLDIIPYEYFTFYSEEDEVAIGYLKNIQNILKKRVGPFIRGYSFYINAENTVDNSSIFGVHLDNKLSLFPKWYPVKLSIGDYRINGVTAAGMPFFFSSNNGSIYYSAFKLKLDSQSIYKERVRYIGDKEQYFLNGRWRNFGYIGKKTFSNKRYRKTLRGVVISDIAGSGNQKKNELSLKSNHLNSKFIKLLFGIIFEEDINKIRRDLYSQSAIDPYVFILADKKRAFKEYIGEIPSDSYVPNRTYVNSLFYNQYQAGIKIRNYNFYDKKNYLVSDSIWQRTGGLAKYVVPTNNFRYETLNKFLNEKNLSVGELTRIFNDNYNPEIEIYAPLLQVLLEKNPITSAKLSRIYLKDKNYKLSRELVNPTILNYLYYYFLREVLIDDLQLNFATLMENDFLLYNKLERFVQRGTSRLFDDVRTRERIEDRDYIFDRAFIKAMRGLHRKYGARMGAWTWGNVHRGGYRMPLEEFTPEDSKAPLNGGNSSIFKASSVFDPILGAFEVDEVSALTYISNNKDLWSVNYGTSMLKISGFYNPEPGEEVFFSIKDLSQDYYYEINPIGTSE